MNWNNFMEVWNEFLAFMDGLNVSGDRIAYNEDGTATVKL